MVEREFIYRTALAKNILPFFITTLPYIILPVLKDKGEFKIKSANELRSLGFRGVAEWFITAENEWNDKHKSKSYRMNLYQRLDYQKTLTNQNPRNEWTVLYNTSGKNINSAVLDVKTIDKPFYADAKTYWYYAKSKKEAFYLCGILNSEIVNQIIKPFQSYGLLGERDIHTKVLEIPIPKFDQENEQYNTISELGEYACKIVKDKYEKNEINGTLAKQRATAKMVARNEIDKVSYITKKLLNI